MKKVLVATEKPFAPIEIKGIREVIEAAGYQLELLEKYTAKEQLLQAVADADAIIEIGPGAGVLTVELAKRAKKVVSIEIDEKLRPVLNETLAEYDNVEVVFGDVMKIDLKQN